MLSHGNCQAGVQGNRRYLPQTAGGQNGDYFSNPNGVQDPKDYQETTAYNNDYQESEGYSDTNQQGNAYSNNYQLPGLVAKKQCCIQKHTIGTSQGCPLFLV